MLVLVPTILPCHSQRSLWSQLIRDHTSPPARLVLKSIRKAAEGGRQGYLSPKEIVHTLSRAEALAPVGSCKSSDFYTIGQQNKRTRVETPGIVVAVIVNI